MTEMAENEYIEYDDIISSGDDDDIEPKETLDTVEVEETVDYEISVYEGIVFGSTNADGNHALLHNRELQDQHPISAITGLREELDNIEKLKTVYSDKTNIANYYSWNDGAYEDAGYFVSIVPNSSTIKICEGEDIFGVSISSAAFVGGQDENIPRDYSYGLIVTSGLVDVRCELDVEVGDYVTSNSRGFAKKSTSDFGYKVFAKENKNGVEYVAILLGVQADVVDALGQDVLQLQNLVNAHDSNIVAAINIANQAYQKSAESVTVSNDAVKKALEAMQNSEEAVANIGDISEALQSTSSVATQARAIAESAATSAMSIRDEAINRANDAWAMASEVATETYSLCAKIDAYSVGEYSQAQGLTWEQAQGILESGMIYAPTEFHTEIYENSDDSEAGYERIFTPEYLYQWGYLPNLQKYGWITIDKHNNPINYDSMPEVNTAAKSVYFSYIEPAVAQGEDFGYWYTNASNIEDKDGMIGTYEPYTLYKWEKDHWFAVATLKGNVNNRMTSEIYQTTNQISLTLSNARGSFASLDERLTETESKLDLTTQWAKGDDGTGKTSYNLAAVELTSDEEGSSLALVVADENGNQVLNGATLVLSQETGGNSFIELNADEIQFTGSSIFTQKNSDGTKVTAINGSCITTGAIQSADYVVNVSGSRLDLISGSFDSKHFKASDEGGFIGGWTITEAGLSRNSTKLITDDSVVDASLVTDGETSPIRLSVGEPMRTETMVFKIESKEDGYIDNYYCETNKEIISFEWIDYIDSEGMHMDDLVGNFECYLSNETPSGIIVDGYVPSRVGITATFVFRVVYKVKPSVRILEDGSLYAIAANITGEVNTGKGFIGGWTIANQMLTTETDDFRVTFQSPTSYGAEDGTASVLSIYDKQGEVSPFCLYSDGSLVATKANITGVIHATEGNFVGCTIGGFVIGEHDLFVEGKAADNMSFASLSLSDDGSVISKGTNTTVEISGGLVSATDNNTLLGSTLNSDGLVVSGKVNIRNQSEGIAEYKECVTKILHNNINLDIWRADSNGRGDRVVDHMMGSGLSGWLEIPNVCYLRFINGILVDCRLIGEINSDEFEEIRDGNIWIKQPVN